MKFMPTTDKSTSWIIRSARAIDGDTIEARVDLGFTVSVEIRCRLRGFFAAEKDGRTPGAAVTATERLQKTLDNGELSFPRHTTRRDNHGRWVIILHQFGQALNPHEVLGPWQLTEQDHQADLAFARSSRRKGGAAL